MKAGIPLVRTASAPASSAASWHSTTAPSSEKQGWLPPPWPAAGLQALAHLYWDEGSGGWGDMAAPQGLCKHTVGLSEGQFQVR